MSKSGTDMRVALSKVRLLPVVVLEEVAQAAPLTDALLEGGLPIAEVTFRTEAAAASIEAIASNSPDMLIGAGTVLTVQQVALAHDAGAQFLVTPGFNPQVVEEAQRRGLPIVPGVNNPTAVEAAMSAGLDILKFFPAEASGGTAMLNALSGPYGNVSFVPTGGIGLANVSEYLCLKNVLACGGSWMVDPKLIKSGDFQKITELTRGAVVSVAV